MEQVEGATALALGQVVQELKTRGAEAKSQTTVEWDACGSGKLQCEEPVTRTRHYGLKRKVLELDQGRYEGKGRWIDMHVRCRKCKACLEARAAHWRQRGIAETLCAVRTWYCTFTLTADEQYRATVQARIEAARRGVNWKGLTDDEKFVRKAREAGKELTLFLKRVRKNSGAPISYLLVTEAHKSGEPHWHALIHEKDMYKPVTKAVLEAAWPRPRVRKFVLVKFGETKPANYVCKYLSKSMLCRVRASTDYGTKIHSLRDEF
jgi:hypothetical protein